MDDEIYFEITDGPDIIKIEPLQWTHPNSDNDWDKNWIRSRITVKGGAFRGPFGCDLFSSDFELFKRQLKKAYDNLRETATFKTMEGQIEISCVGDGLGHFTVDCKAMDEAGTGNELNLTMTFDQTSIPDIIRQLDSITKMFPIQGTELNVQNE
jgi:hypothetical protein